MGDNRTLREAMISLDSGTCGWSKRKFRNGEGTALGKDRHGNWRLVSQTYIHTLKSVHTIGVFIMTSGNVAKRAAAGVPDDMPVVLDFDPSCWKDSDRAWFEAHPERTHRARSPQLGELEKMGIEILLDPGMIEMMIVRQVEPGHRYKIPCSAFPEMNVDDDRVLSVLFDQLSEAKRIGRARVPFSETLATVASRLNTGTA